MPKGPFYGCFFHRQEDLFDQRLVIREDRLVLGYLLDHSAEESRRLLESVGKSIRPVLIISLNTGMRKNEILSLKWSNVDFTRGYILIEKSKSEKPRNIPMNGAVSSAIKPLPQIADFVFCIPETKAPVQGYQDRVFGSMPPGGDLRAPVS